MKGSGTLTLGGANTYTGATTVNSGTLLLTGSINGSTKSNLIVAGGTFNYQGSTTNTMNNLNVNQGQSTVATSGAGNLALGAIVYAPGGTVNFTPGTGNITTSNSLVANIIGGQAVFNGGTTFATITSGNIAGLTSYGSNFNGSTTSDVPSGTTSYSTGSSNKLGNLRFNATGANTIFNINSGSTTEVNSGVSGAGGAGFLVTPNVGAFSVTIEGDNLVTNSSNSTDLIIQQYNTQGSLTIQNRLSMTNALVKSGPGTLILTATNNNYSGSTIINGGTISVAANGAAANTLQFNGGALQVTGTGQTISNSMTINALGGTLDVTGSNSDTFSGAMSGSGGLTKIDSGTVVLSATNSESYSGATTITLGTIKMGKANQIPNTPLIVNGTLDLNNFTAEAVSSLAGSGTITNSTLTSSQVILTIGSDNTSSTFSGSIYPTADSTDNFSLIKTGSGALTLSGASNNFGGSVSINNGKIIAGHANVLGNSANANNLLNVTNSGNTLDLAGFSQTVQALNGLGTIDNSSATAATLTVLDTIYTTATNTFAGNLVNTGAGGLGLTFSGNSNSRILVLTGTSNTYSGQTQINANGEIWGGANNSFSPDSQVNITSGILNLRGFNESIGSLTGVAAGIVTSTTSGTFVLTLGNDNSNASFPGTITAGSGSSFGLTKTGTGTQTLGGVNTYNGPTNVSQGTLDIASGGALAAASAVAVNSGGTLSGGGTIGGSLTVNSGGSLQPGDGPGPGTIATAATKFKGGGNFNLSVNNAVGAAGTNWSQQSLGANVLTLDSSITSSAKFNVNLTGLTSGNVAGAVLGFNQNAGVTWIFANSSSAISGTFTAANYSVSATNFANNNPIGAGSFSVATANGGKSLAVVFNPNTLGVIASDTAGNYSAWSASGSTPASGGSGFGSWSFSNTNASSSVNGELLGGAGSGTLINSANGNALGLYANSSNTANAIRGFSTSPLGQIFTIDLESQSGYAGSQGVTLQHGTATGGTGVVQVFAQSGKTNYQYNDSTGQHDTGVPVSTTGARLELTLAAAQGYSFTITPYSTGVTSAAFTGTGNAGAVDTLVLLDFNSGNSNNAYFNNPRQLLPTWSGLSVGSGGGDFSSVVSWAAHSPVNGGSVAFDGTGSTVIDNAATSGITSLYNISFNGTITGQAANNTTNAGPYTLQSTGLTAAGLTISGGITNASTNPQNINFAGSGSVGITLGASQTFDAGSGGLTFGASTGIDLHGNTLTVQGFANTTIGAAISNSTGTGALTKLGSATLVLNAAATYNGATTISGGTVLAGAANVLSPNSSVNVTAGALDVSGFANTVNSLNVGSGGTLRVGLGAGSTSNTLTSTNPATLAGTLSISGTPTLGSYTLISYPSATGTFGTTPSEPGYALIYGSGSLILQHLGTIGTISATPDAPSIISGGSTTFSFTVQNSSPSGGADLNFSATALTNVAGSVPGPVNVPANSTSAAQSGLMFSGTAVGSAQTGTFRVSDANATNSPQTGSVAVNVYDHATTGGFSGGTLHLGYIHQGYAAAVGSTDSLNVTNGALTDYRADLKATSGVSNNVTVAGFGGVAPGASGAITATLAPGQTAGLVNESVGVTFADDSMLSGASSVGSASVNVVGTVYTGQSTWIGGSGAWSNNANWVDNTVPTVNAAPGLDPNFTTTDSATFGKTSGSVSVDLNGAMPSLNVLTFNSTGSYTISDTPATGSITLAGTTPTINVVGTHAISAALKLAADTTITVSGAADQLSISEPISGAHLLSLAGAGTLVLNNGSNSYSGGTVVSSGTLRVANASGASATGTGDVTLNGGTLTSGPVGSIGGTVRAGTGMSAGPHTIAPGGIGAIGALSVGGLNLSANTTLNFDITSPSNLDALTDSGALALASSGVNVVVPTGLASGTYKLVGYGSTVLTNASGFEINGGMSPAGYNLNLNTGASELDLMVGSSNASLLSLAPSHLQVRSMVGGSQTGTVTLTESSGTDAATYSTVASGAATATAPSGSISAGGPTNVAIGFSDYSTTGARSGSVTFTNTANTSDGFNSSGNAVTLDAGSAVVDNRVVTASGTVNLGAVHVGGTGSGVASLTTSGDNNHFTAVTVAGTLYNSDGQAGSAAINPPLSTAGSISSSVMLSTTGEGLSGESPTNVSVPYVAQVFTGLMTWNPATTTGSWATDGNWTDTASSATAGAPGLSGALSVANDTATFDNATAATLVNLDNASPHVAAVTFGSNNGGNAYTVAQGAGSGALHLDDGGGMATITANSGGHLISAPVMLDSNTTVSVSNLGDTLSISGAIGGSGGLTKTGPGTLTLGATNGYGGGTTVSAGTLRTASNVNGALGGGNLNVSASDNTASALNLSGNETVSGLSGRVGATNSSATISVAAGKTLTVNQATNTVYRGAMNLMGALATTGSGTLELQGAPTLGAGTVLSVGGTGTLRFNIASGAASLSSTSAVIATVGGSATLELDGTVSALFDDGNGNINRPRISNDGAVIIGNTTVTTTTIQQVGGIDGTGSVTVSDGATLTADHINQTSLVIGAGSTFTLAASAPNGDPMAGVPLGNSGQGSAGGGLVLAGSLKPSSTFLLGAGGSLLGASPSTAAPAAALGGSLSGATAIAVPEPASLLLLLFGAVAVWPIMRRRIRRAAVC